MGRKRVLLIVVAAACVVTTAAASGTPRDLLVSNLFTEPGHMARLAGGVTYQASSFPLALRVTPPDGSWAGAQWKTAAPNKVAPFYGWAVLGHGGTNPHIPPQGSIAIMSAYDRTPSVNATVIGLRTRGHGATYGATSPVTIHGFSGVQFDAQVVGKRHIFVPFSPPSNRAKYYPDAYEAFQGEALRLIVLGVRGKTIVSYIDNDALSANQFPAFLSEAEQILKSLAFPQTKGG